MEKREMKYSLQEVIDILVKLNEEVGIDVLDWQVLDARPKMAVKARRQKVDEEKHNELFSDVEYVDQRQDPYICDSYSGTIARKIKHTNIWILLKFEC